ncbi:MAG: hypothetical protein LC620_03380 [Halobacteriales archaeon]|nr:hypothetical protein [Halobacteriales archaeon]
MQEPARPGEKAEGALPPGGLLPGLLLAPGDDALRQWAQAMPPGTAEAYVRFPRGGDLPLAAVQRLARRARILADARPQDADDVLDLAVAGAHGLVVWMHETPDAREMGDAMGDGFVLGCRPADLERARPIAKGLGCPVLVEGDAPASGEGLHGYTLDLARVPLLLHRFGQWPAPPAAPSPGADEAAGEATEGRPEGEASGPARPDASDMTDGAGATGGPDEAGLVDGTDPEQERRTKGKQGQGAGEGEA